MARDPYEVVLADLRAKRDEIDKVIRTLEGLRPGMPQAVAAAVGPAPVQGPPPAPGGPYFGMSIVDGATAVLKGKCAPMGNAEIAEAIQAGGLAMNSAEPPNTVSSVLHRAWENGGEVVRVGRGKWGLKDWYPGQDTSKPGTGRAADKPSPADPPDLSDALDPWFSREQGPGLPQAAEDEDIPF